MIAIFTAFQRWESAPSLSNARSLAGSSARKFNCQDLFAGINKKAKPLTPPSPLQPVSEETIVVGIGKYGHWLDTTHPSNVYHLVALKKTYVRDNLTTTEIAIEQRHGYPPQENGVKHQNIDLLGLPGSTYDVVADKATENWQKIRAEIFESIEFARSEFATRRLWHSSFLENMKSVALEHILNSTYLTVREPDGQIVSTLRIFRKRYEARRTQTLLWGKPVASSEKTTFGELQASLESYFDLKNSFDAGASVAGVITEYRDTYGDIPITSAEKVTAFSLLRPVYWLWKKSVAIPTLSSSTPGYSVNIEVGVGEVIEPGLWAVRKSPHSGTYALESIFHLVRLISDNPNFFPRDFAEKGRYLVTYGDEVSVKFYKLLGLSVLRGDPTLAYQTNWWPLGLDGESAKNLLEELAKLQRTRQSPEYLELKKLLQESIESLTEEN